MIFRSLTLSNFGTYSGDNRLDLAPEGDRPVVLVGGTNGAGKTTVLEALLLCLHGRRALGPAVRQRDYEAHVASRIHMPPSGEPAPESASLRLVFDHTEGGRSTEYLVERAWTRKGPDAVSEQLRLSRYGELVEELPESAWQDFLDGLVPPGIADLFLFDGERIQELADDESGQQLKDAVRRLMGLDVVEQLQADLRRYVSRESKDDAPELHRAVEAAKAVVDEIATGRERLERRRGELDAEIETLKARNERVRARLAQQGGVLADERAELEGKERRAIARSAGLKAEVQELVAGLLPFAICPGVADAVTRRLEVEQQAEEDEIVRGRLAEQRRKLTRALEPRQGEGSVAEILEAALVGDVSERAERIHDLTPSERVLLADQLRRTREDVPARAAKLARQLSRAEEAQAAARDQLDLVPDDDGDVFAPLILELQDLERELGTLQERLARIDDELRQLDHEDKVAQRERRLAEDKAKRAESTGKRAALALSTIQALDRFGRETQAAKLERVEHETALFFNRLSRKGEMLSGVRVDPETFTVDLMRWDGSELPKDRLSAGEKQLFAIAVLWAFAKVAGRPLPVVIDTPLARLDREHREKLLNEYLPHVSHQVVVLSTDTEVDAAAAARLEPVTARSYHLEHDAKLCRTRVVDGYFHPQGKALDAR